MNVLEEKFNEFDANNPHVWDLFVKFADEAKNSGRNVYSVNAILKG